MGFMRNGEMSAVRNRIFEDFPESGIVRNLVLLGKMSTKKRNVMKMKRFYFPAFFTKKIKNTKEIPRAHRHFLAVLGVE